MITETTSENVATIRWDDLTISNEGEHMPAELREDYRWLKAYTRDACNRDIEILTARFREVGVLRDRTTWATILRGRYQRDSHGRQLANPKVSGELFCQEVEALRSQIRIESMRGLVPFIETTTWDAIDTLITARRDTARVNKFAMIVGPTGSQKTACLREYRNRNNHGMTTLIEAPEEGRLGEFLRLLSLSYGAGAKLTTNQMRARIMAILGAGTAAERAKRCIIIDNAQECWIKDTKSEQPVFTFLRRLQDTTGCTIVLSITPIFERTLMSGMIEGWFEQIEGRTGGRNRWLRLPEYAPDEDVIAIAKAFGLRDVKGNLKLLRDISREPGRVRRLFEDLQEGKILAGKDPFTVDHIREVRGEK
jgi:DNA transposition AAA+ family ATPase